MKSPTLLLCAATIVLALALPAVTAAGVLPAFAGLPAPAARTPGTGVFKISTQTRLVARGTGAEPAARLLQTMLRVRTGIELPIARPASSTGVTAAAPVPAITLELAAAPATEEEAYTLAIAPEGIVLRATAPAGLFYAVQTLWPLAEVGTEAGAWRVPTQQITDQPRFAWRGVMLDESRHFFGKAVVKDLLEMMARLKLNRFHWHLTDEPGWRIEIKKYPRLTAVGAIGNWSDAAAPAAYYTQDDIREIVAYAAERHIVIVPEIDMPGHATAACRAYPELSGGGTGQWAGFTFNPARESTYQFLNDVLAEIVALFPGPWVHLGGDEVHYGNQSWSTDPAIGEFTRAHELKDAVGLERYFVRRMAGSIRALGKTPLGWDEIADAGIAPGDCGVFWWRHDQPEVLTKLLQRDYPVVLCPRVPCYFDFVQDAAQTQGRKWQGAFADLDRLYAFPDGALAERIPAGKRPRILGVEGCLWTERIQNTDRLWFMLLPRLAGLAESAWTPAAQKDRAAFDAKLRALLPELERGGWPHFDPFAPAKTPEPAGPARKADGTATG